jgi:hypothetical protein
MKWTHVVELVPIFESAFFTDEWYIVKYNNNNNYYYYYYPNFSLLSFSWEIFTHPGMYHQQD